MRGKAIGHVRRNVIAYLALFVALGGSAYAANKIGTKQLKRNAVTSSKIRNGTIKPVDTAPALANGSRSAKIVTRCRINAPVSVTSAAFANLPGFSGCSWSQPAGTLDSLYARAKVSRPATCTAGENLHLRVKINTGNLVTDFLISPTSVTDQTAVGTSLLLPVNASFAWLTPDWNAPTTVPPYTLVPQGYDICDGNFILNKFEITVVRAAS